MGDLPSAPKAFVDSFCRSIQNECRVISGRVYMKLWGNTFMQRISVLLVTLLSAFSLAPSIAWADGPQVTGGGQVFPRSIPNSKMVRIPN